MRSVRLICLLFFVVGVIVISPDNVFAGNKEDMVRVYPDGGYGIDMGGGYKVLPDGEVLQPEGYREPYQDTEYGPIVNDKFLFFPGYKLSISEKEEDTETKQDENLFHETGGSSPAGNLFQGIYIPGENNTPDLIDKGE